MASTFRDTIRNGLRIRQFPVFFSIGKRRFERVESGGDGLRPLDAVKLFGFRKRGISGSHGSSSSRGHARRSAWHRDRHRRSLHKVSPDGSARYTVGKPRNIVVLLPRRIGAGSPLEDAPEPCCRHRRDNRAGPIRNRPRRQRIHPCPNPRDRRVMQWPHQFEPVKTMNRSLPLVAAAIVWPDPDS